MFDQLLRSMHDSAAGRIRWMPNMWAIVGSRWDKKRVQNKNLAGSRSWINEQGEFVRDGITLVSRQAISHCPSPPGDDFHRNEKDGNYWVPATECRKCPYHRKASRGGAFKYARCVFNKGTTPKEVAEATLNMFAGITEQAIKKTNEIIGQ